MIGSFIWYEPKFGCLHMRFYDDQKSTSMLMVMMMMMPNVGDGRRRGRLGHGWLMIVMLIAIDSFREMMIV